MTTTKINLKKIVCLFLLFYGCFFISTMVKADDDTLHFYVTPEFPESQVEDEKSYFNLNSQPGATEKLGIKLQNASTEPVVIQITPHTAFTNVSGTVEYAKDSEEKDSTLRYSLAELIETPEPITLEGNETKTVDVLLRLPDEKFEGVLAGGLRISEVNTEDEKAPSNEEGVAVKNEFAYVIGVLATNERNVIQPQLDLSDVFANQLNYRNVISATLQNSEPTFVNGLEVAASVRKDGEDEVLYEANQKEMQMAPNSHFDFPISLEGDRFQPGDYILNMKARSNEDEWEWTQKFTIDGTEARELNKEDVTIDSSINWWAVVAITVIIVLAITVIWLAYKRRTEMKKS